MSMFSRVDIINANRMGAISIRPFNTRFLQPNSYKLHLDGELAVAKKGTINPVTTKKYDGFYEKVVLNKKPFVLRPGGFVLGRTVEEVSLSSRVCAFVHGRSSLARMGVSATQSSPVIQAGHGVPTPRKIVLEISNTSPFDIELSKNMIISEICFFELKTPTNMLYDYFGRYGTRKDRNALTPLKE